MLSYKEAPLDTHSYQNHSIIKSINNLNKNQSIISL
nr:MAG TPA: hypothetical protein [Crassvirales sp.]